MEKRDVCELEQMCLCNEMFCEAGAGGQGQKRLPSVFVRVTLKRGSFVSKCHKVGLFDD